MKGLQPFEDAQYLQPARVCGIQLRPFTLAHNYALKTIGNPCIYDGAEVHGFDLARAIWICTMDMQGIRSNVFADRTTIPEGMFNKLGEELGTDDDELQRHLDTFIEHYTAYCNFPRHIKKRGSAPGKHPWEWMNILVLLKYGIIKTRDEGWNMPTNEAQCWMSCIGEYNGQDTLLIRTKEDALTVENDPVLAEMMGGSDGNG